MKLKVALALVSLSLQACTLGIWGKPATHAAPSASKTPSTSKAPSTPAITSGPKASHKHWGYEGRNGSEYWGDLDASFATCKNGKLQSPIDIRYPELAALAPVGFYYRSSAAEVLNNGHSIQVNVNAGGSIRLGGRTNYSLIQFHFHTPSEEKINGNAFPLVAHLVHKNDEGTLAVVAILFMLGDENQALKPIFDAMPEEEGDRNPLKGEINLANILPEEHGFYAFMGSLTTPPCSEGVRWIVLRQPAEISESQLAAFKRLYPMNARPVQPVNGRKIYEGF
jgi:carbonic anhydrase